jgi:hypothetical protein
MSFPIYLYSAIAFIGWLILWFGDVCQLKYGFSCNKIDAELLSIRMLSLMFLYLTVIPFILTPSNKDNGPFLKQLTFHLQYGLMAIIGCSIARNPPPPPPPPPLTSSNNDSIVENDEASCYHFADKISTMNAFFNFIRLHGEN